MRRLVDGHIDIVLRYALRGRTIGFQVDLIETKVDGTGRGSIELIWKMKSIIQTILVMKLLLTK